MLGTSQLLREEFVRYGWGSNRILGQMYIPEQQKGRGVGGKTYRAAGSACPAS